MYSKPAATILATACMAASALAQGPSAKTKSGDVNGVVLQSGARAWMGIPFAKSPPIRFAPPQDPEPWASPLSATKAKPSCLQQFSYPEEARNITISIFSTPMPEESEDCLYLNVYSPSKTPPAGGFPVMFWIYGGNLQFGHAALPIYNGEHMAMKRDVVVVTVNYRLNRLVFGFPNSPELANGENNLGFLDQRKALDWVNKNIASFGGNPEKVLLFGESAGGYSVKQLVANPPSPIPFHAAIMQSEASGVRGSPEGWRKVAEELKCGSTNHLACVRAAPATKIKDIIEKGKYMFGPKPDNVTHVYDVRNNIKTGLAAKVPIIIGTNAEEGTPFLKIGLAGNGTLASFLGAFIGSSDMAGMVLNVVKMLYPQNKYPNEFLFGAAMFTDIAFQCIAGTLARAFVDSGYTVYRYYYAASFPEEDPFPNAGAFHSAEILPIFRTYDPKNTRLDRLSDVMQGIWTGLAHSPEAPIADWPKMTKNSEPVREFGVESDKTVAAASVDTRCWLLGGLAQVMGV